MTLRELQKSPKSSLSAPPLPSFFGIRIFFWRTDRGRRVLVYTVFSKPVVFLRLDRHWVVGKNVVGKNAVGKNRSRRRQPRAVDSP